ncbi:hypothetical protein BURPS406E_D0389 [Burkholderia pseudomallei 406e]|nr:hypothetical protein BMA10247_A0184 [Burkholderia mallei NCTC 10247]EDO88253.1 hypothetical protein BURPS406E_D0389 [Burkholderia pseudomallei 406e]EDO89305.1 hypothetical protein BURPSPAST_AC0311 [Burkholderia pseudomallei Pasteur 52237]EDP87317.1 hypothetical protein BMA10399_B1532 [Burkholderia mallei ATCC 10399]EDS83741.1 hypothetical protein BURPSS13_X0750 [Burkholderia pseudomallei S13]EDU12304.1 hypothetical protein BURPS1655_D1189 [Burkholderia pseudomallei 1655]
MSPIPRARSPTKPARGCAAQPRIVTSALSADVDRDQAAHNDPA